MITPNQPLESPTPSSQLNSIPTPQKIWTPFTVGLTVFVVVIIFGIVFFDKIINQPVIKQLLTGVRYQSDKRSDSVLLPTSTPIPTPTPIQLHEGIGEYTVSHGETNGPTIVNIIFDPLDVRKDQLLTLSVNLRSQDKVTSVTGTLETDTGSIALNFTLSQESKGVQTWITKITMTDTLWYTYIANITAKSDKGETSVTVAPRS